MTADTPLFSLSGLGFRLGARALLHDVTLDVPAGAITGLIGHNGSGKSTLLKILARQLRASSGAVTFGGQRLERWGGRAFARQVAYLPQHLPPTAGMLVEELVALGRYPWHGALGRITGAGRQVVRAAIADTGIAAFCGRQVDTLSGGERQRVWLAMLLAQEPRCLLLDEPISALDIAHQVEVLTLVRRLALARGMGVVIVLHDVNMAARFCDGIVALKGGELVARMPPEALMVPEELRRIYGIDMDVMRQPATGLPVALPR
ncbi:ATP-binding cassette domain-containing protein [Paroceanicella profunda]|uniref:ATP-binding cassette domain-containing protein n=1 Tax=Paroceanicella profunda TaxID=2579971 RepID=A0A5B8FW80_9RHOB|nr:ATP-binding cassette domain-containing protein [Paroceanicella profunda]QDL91470.1 ATP-binding cassette domain-containing protein [Paroceanicella profunda]